MAQNWHGRAFARSIERHRPVLHCRFGRCSRCVLEFHRIADSSTTVWFVRGNRRKWQKIGRRITLAPIGSTLFSLFSITLLLQYNFVRQWFLTFVWVVTQIATEVNQCPPFSLRFQCHRQLLAVIASRSGGQWTPWGVIDPQID